MVHSIVAILSIATHKCALVLPSVSSSSYKKRIQAVAIEGVKHLRTKAIVKMKTAHMTCALSVHKCLFCTRTNCSSVIFDEQNWINVAVAQKWGTTVEAKADEYFWTAKRLDGLRSMWNGSLQPEIKNRVSRNLFRLTDMLEG